MKEEVNILYMAYIFLRFCYVAFAYAIISSVENNIHKIFNHDIKRDIFLGLECMSKLIRDLKARSAR